MSWQKVMNCVQDPHRSPAVAGGEFLVPFNALDHTRSGGGKQARLATHPGSRMIVVKRFLVEAGQLQASQHVVRIPDDRFEIRVAGANGVAGQERESSQV